MSPNSHSVWYRLGHAWESARLPARPTRVAKLKAEHRPRDGRLNGGLAENVTLLRHLESALLSGSGTVVARALGRRSVAPGATGRFALRAALAGAGAAVLARSVRPLVRRNVPLASSGAENLVEEVLVGVGDGLTLGGLARLLPGGRLARGAVYAAAGYVASPWGGLTRVLRPLSPTRAPLIAALVGGSDAVERTFLEHVAFGVAFSLLYRSRPASRGTVVDE